MPSGPSLPAESTMSVSLNLRLPATELFSPYYVNVCFQLSSTTLAPGATLPWSIHNVITNDIMSWKSSPALWNMEPRPLRTKHAQQHETKHAQQHETKNAESTNKACSVYQVAQRECAPLASRGRVDNVMHCLSCIVSHETYKHSVDYYAELVSPVVYRCTQDCWCKVALHLGSIAAALQISLWYNYKDGSGKTNIHSTARWERGATDRGYGGSRKQSKTWLHVRGVVLCLRVQQTSLTSIASLPA